MSTSTSTTLSIKKIQLKEKVKSCCVKNCDLFFKEDQNRFFYHFPPNVSYKIKWMKILGMQEVKQTSQICNRHFAAGDFFESSRDLKPTAIPSLYLNIIMENRNDKILWRIKNEAAELEEYAVSVKTEIEDAEDQQVDDITCRICLKTKSSMVWLFDHYEIEETVAGIFTYCTGLHVQENDRLPQFVCEECFDKLVDFTKLKKSSIEADNILKSRLEDQTVEEFVDYIVDESEIKQESKEILDDLLEVDDNDNVPVKSKRARPSKSKTPRRKQPSKQFFFCEICSLEIEGNRTYHLKEHLKNGEEPARECKDCFRKFLSEGDYLGHHCQASLKYCELCQIEFQRTVDFQKHLGETHFENGVYICQEPNCDEKKTSVPLAYQHIKWHKYHFEGVCATCGMIFSDPVKMLRHRHHTAEPCLTCDVCGTQVKGKSNMMRHMRASHLKLKFYCELCPKSYTDPMVLRAHKITHHGQEGPFKCAQCTRSFLFMSQLKKHQQNLFCRPPRPNFPLTSAERMVEFKCKVCEKIFSLKANLTRHVLTTHENIRRFECEICKKLFTQKTALDTHLRIHTGEKPFECQICFVKYSDRSTLYKHTKSQHSEESNLSKTTRKKMKKENYS